MLGSVAGVALYNFFLTEPRLTFHAYDPGYQVTFALMLTSAIITCALTTRLKDHAKMSAQVSISGLFLFFFRFFMNKVLDFVFTICSQFSQI